MLMRSTIANAVAAFGITVTAYGVQATPVVVRSSMADGPPALIQKVRNSAQPVRRIISSRSSAGEKCGVWRCTWPTSGGGCLVWEKTACKIKTIDPFE